MLSLSYVGFRNNALLNYACRNINERLIRRLREEKILSAFLIFRLRKRDLIFHPLFDLSISQQAKSYMLSKKKGASDRFHDEKRETPSRARMKIKTLNQKTVAKLFSIITL